MEVRNQSFRAGSNFFDHGYSHQFGEDEDDWEDDDDDEDGPFGAGFGGGGFGPGGPRDPECRTQ